MSTVTPSTSNIERSTNFVSKNAQTKNQASNPIANAFAALLMSAEEVEAPVSANASGTLADDGRASTDNTQGANATPPTDAGQAALAGLLNWQALAAADNSAQGAAGNTTSSAGTNSTPMISLLATQVDLSKPGKLSADTLTGNVPGSSTAPFAQGIAQTSLQAVDPIPGPLQPEQPTSIANNPVTGIDVSSMVPTTEASVVPLPANPTGLATSQATAEVLTNGADRVGFAKTRVGASRNPSPAGAATAKAGAGATLQSNAPSGKATEPDLLPRATVDLVARPESEVASGTADASAPADESAPFKREEARLVAETGAPGAEHLHTSDHTPTTLAPTDLPPPAGTTPDSSMADVMDNLSGQIAYWAAQGSQKASLTVGDDKDNPLEVNISMRDGEVHVAFEATQAEVRNALTTSAEDLLKTMLESKGMTLGDVTVGQRQSPADSGASTSENRQGSDQAITPRTASGTQHRAAAGSTDSLAQPPRRPTIATATKLDLFA